MSGRAGTWHRFDLRITLLYICVPSITLTVPVNVISLIIGELLLVAHYLSLLLLTVRELKEFSIQVFLASLKMLIKLPCCVYVVFCFFSITSVSLSLDSSVIRVSVSSPGLPIHTCAGRRFPMGIY